jgi:putative ABC transport system permease protein
VLSVWGTSVLASLYAYDSAGRPIAFDVGLSGTVVVATAGLTLLTALVAGLAPAVQASRGDLVGVLKDEGASGGARRARLRTALVTAQVAVSVVLIVGAALLIQSAAQVYRGPGFDPAPLVTLRLRPSLVDYPRERAHAFQRDVLRRLESLPGVSSASPSVYMAMFSAGTRVRVSAAGAAGEPLDAIGSPVGPRYFETLGQALLAGREFTEQDRSGAPLVMIVNDALAQRLWAGGNAVGQTLVADGQSHTVVGVVRDAQYYVTGEAPRPQLFLSYWQPHGGDAFLNDARTFVRVAGDPAVMMPAIRRAIAEVDPAVPLVEDHPFRDRVSYMFQPVRMARGLLLAFALLAVVLSAVGLYGVLAFTVSQRTREIGVRLALGARRGQIASLVLRDGLVLTTIGTALGLAAAWSAGQFVASLLFGLDPHNLVAFIAAPIVLAAVALVASYLPARRAAGVSPLTAIRYE